MAVAPQLLELLRCPVTRQRLLSAPAEMVSRLEAARSEGRLHYADGRAVEIPIEAGLICEDGALFYLIQAGLPLLLPDERIPVANQFPDRGSTSQLAPSQPPV